MSNKDVKQDALDNLADALTEDILNTPDDELLREVEEDYGDPRALANKFDQILERAEKQVFGTARPAASPQVQSSLLELLHRLREWASTLFGEPQFQLSSLNRMVWVGAAIVLIVLILAPAVYFEERSRQLAALEKEQLARSEQLAAQEKELLARSEQLKGPPFSAAAAAVGAPVVPLPSSEPYAFPGGTQDRAAVGDPPAAEVPTSQWSILCKYPTWPFEHQICGDADLAFWQHLVSDIYQHKWRQLDANGQQVLRQSQLDWLKNMRVNCNLPETGPWNAAEMARAKLCVLQSTKERVAILSNS